MRRKWKKRPVFCLLCMAVILAVMNFMLAGCQKKVGADGLGDGSTGETGSSLASDKAGDWQTQYDLGIRYLSEGKYEEAIIAFRVAIEIEPKRAAGYTSLAEAYTKNGQTDEARKVLMEAPDDVDDYESIKNALEQLEPYKNRKNYVNYDAMTEEERKITDLLIEGTLSGDESAIIDVAYQYEKLPRPSFGDGYSEDYRAFYTERGEYCIGIKIGKGVVNNNRTSLDTISVEMEIRTERGAAYFYKGTFDIGTGGEQSLDMVYAKGSCVDWLWEGKVTYRIRSWNGPEFAVDGEAYGTSGEMAGTLHGDLRTGTFTSRETSTFLADGYSFDSTFVRNYEEGKQTGETTVTYSYGETESYEEADMEAVYGVDWYPTFLAGSLQRK